LSPLFWEQTLARIQLKIKALYTKIEFVVPDLQVHRNTAKKHLDTLVEINLIDKHKTGKENFYINTSLFNLLQNNMRRVKSPLL
jgi:Fic family protein